LTYIVKFGLTSVDNEFSGLQYTSSPSQIYYVDIIANAFWKAVDKGQEIRVVFREINKY